jgi:hypothetical protein
VGVALWAYSPSLPPEMLTARYADRRAAGLPQARTGIGFRKAATAAAAHNQIELDDNEALLVRSSVTAKRCWPWSWSWSVMLPAH